MFILVGRRRFSFLVCLFWVFFVVPKGLFYVLMLLWIVSKLFLHGHRLTVSENCLHSARVVYAELQTLRHCSLAVSGLAAHALFLPSPPTSPPPSGYFIATSSFPPRNKPAAIRTCVLRGSLYREGFQIRSGEILSWILDQPLHSYLTGDKSLHLFGLCFFISKM